MIKLIIFLQLFFIKKDSNIIHINTKYKNDVVISVRDKYNCNIESFSYKKRNYIDISNYTNGKYIIFIVYDSRIEKYKIIK